MALRCTHLLLALTCATSALGQEEDAFEVPHRSTAPPLAHATSLPPEADLLSLASSGPDGRWYLKNEPLTIDVALQRQLVDLLKTYQTPWAAVVALEPSTGRVLAMAEHSEADPALRGLCTKAVYPAASIFKIVTASALLEAGVSPDEQACFHGGKRGITETLLEDSPADTRCVSFAEALGLSANVAFAKMTARYLDPVHLTHVARQLHFNAPFVFPIPTDVSLAAIPEPTLGLATTGAGFGDVYLSPLHGAALIAMTANHGLWRAPVLFERDVAHGTTERALDPKLAAQLVDMLSNTVTQGTARRIFHERGFQVDAVGKTGSLADKTPVFRDYSWFVGFAPKDHPRIAVAAVVVNDAYWRIRGTWLGREAMRLFLERHAAPTARDAGVASTPSLGDAGVTP